jgi:thymidine phosphorylase
MAFFISADFPAERLQKRLWILTIAFFVFGGITHQNERRKTMIKEALGKVVLKRDLTEGEMEKVMEEITKGSASDAQIASFVTALRMKGETPEEITAAAKVIKNKVSVSMPVRTVCMDREEIW